VAFENSRALTPLQKHSKSRDDVVQRATELVGDVITHAQTFG